MALTAQNPLVPRAGYPYSRAELAKVAQRGPLRRFLERFAYRDVVYTFDDFTGATINLDLYAVANSAGTGAVNFAVPATPLVNGAIRGESGTTSNGSISLVGPKIYGGDQNAGIEARLKFDAVTALNFEVGFIDAVPGSNGSGVSDVDTPAATMTDGALLALDTSQTLTTAAFVTAGTLFTTTATPLSGFTTPTAATYFTVRVQLVGNEAYCWVNGALLASHTGSKVEGGNLLAPWVYVRTRDTTTKKCDVDYISLWANRS